MKRKLLFLVALFIGVGFADAAVRDTNSVPRASQQQSANRSGSRQQDAAQKSVTSRSTKNTSVRSTITSRAARTGTATARSAKNISTARSATPNTARNAKQSTARAATAQIARSAKISTARSSVEQIDTTTSFGSGYNTCRDAYFTCMDQFCAGADDSYRRCICSSRLTEIQSRERALGQASTRLQDFKEFNISVIDKTSAEVGAMISATIGEQTAENTKDTSDSAAQLSNISDVLSGTKSKSLSTQGSLDIAGDINQIWSTTDLTDGANIATLTGEALYNAVHAQCSELVAESCPNAATKTMVVSAYGMYIENDCSLLISGLDKKLTAANSEIRNTENEMGAARYENYNAHNSTPINDCIAQVRKDITSNVACGTDYVHCLDVTGRYLNIETGEPIYSPEFFELDNQLSLSGDILKNQTNTMFIARLNDMKSFAERGLDTCRDISAEVWDEFMRQAITEIHQGQQERIRKVKNECLDVVNQCYDTQNNQLKDFSNIEESMLLGQRLELSEQMCKEKLDTCSNLYGGGTQGMQELITTMTDIVSQQIAQQCQDVLRDYAKKLCAVPSNDSLHSYPYNCRIYTPGDRRFSANHTCNLSTSNSFYYEPTPVIEISHYNCPTLKCYTSCVSTYYLDGDNCETTNCCKCKPCPAGYTCAGGDAAPVETESRLDCGDYVGSLYHKMVRYARQVCMRPSATVTQETPYTVLQDVSMVMDEIRQDMATSLSKECERLGGQWNSTPPIPDETGKIDTTNQHDKFYFETSANTKWGVCEKTEEETTTETETQ